MTSELRGYQMFQHLEISGFKCFESVKLQRLKRINVIVGGNGSGKTALLESLYFMSGASPALVNRADVWRGILGPKIEFSPQTFEDLWRQLFHNFDRDSVINISTADNKRGPRSLEICFLPPKATELPKDLSTGEIVSSIRPVQFTWQVGKRKYPVRLELKNGKLDEPIGTVPEFPIVFLSPSNPHPGDDIGRFSSLSIHKSLEPVIAALHEEFPLINSLSLEKHLGWDTIFADIENIPLKIPIGAVSAGTKKLLSILMAIACNIGGVVLLDELENGFHFRHYKSIWKRLAQWTQDFSCQTFVSTHSRECLESLIPAVDENETLFSLLRVEQESGVSIVKHFNGGDLLAALKEDVEIR